MFRLWGKIIHKNRIKSSYVYESTDKLETEVLVKNGLEDICYHFGLAVPMWLADNEKHMKKFSVTSFNQDHFIEKIDFSFLEIEIIETDDKKS